MGYLVLYTGEIVWIDLTNGDYSTIDTEPLTSKIPGRKGIKSWLLQQHIKVGTRPFDPDNVIVFGAGALVGTSAPAACETSIGSLSVITRGINFSHAGGYLAPEMKKAGYQRKAWLR